jgi:hypothetical protein
MCYYHWRRYNNRRRNYHWRRLHNYRLSLNNDWCRLHNNWRLHHHLLRNYRNRLLNDNRLLYYHSRLRLRYINRCRARCRLWRKEISQRHTGNNAVIILPAVAHSLSPPLAGTIVVALTKLTTPTIAISFFIFHHLLNGFLPFYKF